MLGQVKWREKSKVFDAKWQPERQGRMGDVSEVAARKVRSEMGGERVKMRRRIRVRVRMDVGE